MKKKTIISKFLCLTVAAVTTLAMAVPAKAATVWNNTSDISWIDSNKKIIAFAFDDGPVSNSNTANSILNTLQKNKMHATFFYIGNQINSSNQSEIKRANSIGCEVANHTFTHPYLTNMNASQIRNEVDKTSNILKGLTGKSNFLIRPPYLATNQTVLNTINVPLVTCRVDTKDWDRASTNQIIQTVLNQAKDGDILLMHENYQTTADAVAYLVPELIKRGYAITSVSELFKIKGQTMTSGKVYTSCPGPNVGKKKIDDTPTPNDPVDPKPDTPTPTPSNNGLKLEYNINNWGSGYQVNFKVKNESTSNVSNWTIKLKKSEIKITSSWNINVKESGDSYVITPVNWNSNIAPGNSVDFGIQGSGNIGTTLSYTLS